MKFNSQICTTEEQSKRLLALGLKKKTADLYYSYYRDRIGYTYDLVPKSAELGDKRSIPAWSLHRLIVLSGMGIIETTTDNIYDKVIQYIEFLIKCGDFNKEYLKE